ncbi:MAG: acyl-CoA thioesterase [Myxococcota bacterium]
MLTYLTRTVPAVLRAQLGRDGRTVSRLERRVSLRQVDVNLHMNQAAYAEVFELGRLDLLIRSKAWSRWRGLGLKPVVAEQHIVYRRELRPLARFDVDTRAVAVEGRLLRFEGHLLVGDRVHARGEAKLIFVGPDGVLPAAEVEAACAGLLGEPLSVRDWVAIR